MTQRPIDLTRHDSLDAANAHMEVLYVDADATTRETTRRALRDRYEQMSVVDVATVASALDVLDRTSLSCLVVDPNGIESGVEQLRAAADCPLVIYTERDPDSLDVSLSADGVTVVEKTPETASVDLLAEKVIAIADTPDDRSEYALTDALSRIERRVGADEAAFLIADDGAVVWSSAPLAALVPDSADTVPETGTFYERLAALASDEHESVAAIESLREASPDPVTVHVPTDGQHRYFLCRGYQLPEAAGGLQLRLLEDVTEAAHRDAERALLELLVDRAQDGLYTLDAEGVIDFCNESFATNLGYDPDEVRGRHASEVLAPGELERGQQTVESLVADPDEQSTTVDLTFVTKDGSTRPMSIHYTLIKDDRDNYFGLMGVVRDVSERKERERELRRYEKLVNAMEDGACIYDAEGRFRVVNERVADYYDATPEELEGQLSPLVHRIRTESAGDPYQELVDGERDEFRCEFEQDFPNDGPVVEEYLLTRLEIDGEFDGVVSVAREITARRERERQLEQSQRRFEAVFNSPQSLYSILDPDGTMLRVNETALSFIEADAATVEGMPFWETPWWTDYSDYSPETVREWVQRAAAGEYVHFEATHTNDDGETITVDGIFQPVIEDGEVVSIVIAGRDISERRQRERELAETTERLDLALEGAELGVWDWNVQTGDVTFDERWTGMLGFELSELEPCYETWKNLVHPDDIDHAEAEIQKHLDGEVEYYQSEFRMRTKDGGWKWINDVGRVFEYDDDGDPVRAVGIHQDITEQKQRQQEIKRQRDELATLDQVHVLIQDIIRALGEAATREEIEETVCSRIVESDLYQLAWIGERVGADGRLVPQASAGDGTASLADLTAETDDRQHLGDLALHSETVEVSQDLAADGRFEPWSDETTDAGLRSAVAVPLVHENVVHGVLCVYADREAAFSDRAVESFTVLGETVGFAFAAVQNRRLLMRDTVLELTFRTDSADTYLVSAANAHDCRLTSLGGIAVGDGAVEYLDVDGADSEAVLDSLTSRAHVHGGRVVNEDDGVIELRLDETFDSLLLDVGARTQDVRADPTGVTVTVEAPTDADPRTIRQMLTRRCPEIGLVARRERQREPTGSGDPLDLPSLLTDRQLEVLRTAYLSGYYAWPRDTTAEQLAETLDISSPTLHQHLRRAERNLFDGLLDI